MPLIDKQKRFVVMEFLRYNAANIENVGSVFVQVFLRLGKFLVGHVFAEAIAPATDHCQLYGEYHVLVV